MFGFGEEVKVILESDLDSDLAAFYWMAFHPIVRPKVETRTIYWRKGTEGHDWCRPNQRALMM